MLNFEKSRTEARKRCEDAVAFLNDATGFPAFAYAASDIPTRVHIKWPGIAVPSLTAKESFSFMGMVAETTDLLGLNGIATHSLTYERGPYNQPHNGVYSATSYFQVETSAQLATIETLRAPEATEKFQSLLAKILPMCDLNDTLCTLSDAKGVMVRHAGGEDPWAKGSDLTVLFNLRTDLGKFAKTIDAHNISDVITALAHIEQLSSASMDQAMAGANLDALTKHLPALTDYIGSHRSIPVDMRADNGFMRQLQELANQAGAPSPRA